MTYTPPGWPSAVTTSFESECTIVTPGIVQASQTYRRLNHGRSCQVLFRNMMRRARVVAAAAIATIVLSVSPLGTAQAQAAAIYYYAGQRSANFFTGSWGYIQNTQVALSNYNDHVAHWLGKTIFNPDGSVKQWMQTGNAIGTARNTTWTQWHYYLEYKDYTMQTPSLWDFGVATGTGNVQYTIWGNGTGGVDGLGQYYNTFLNFNTGPDDVSPNWTTRLTELWTYQDAFGEVLNTTATNEPMGTVCFGCTTFSSQFYDLGWFNNPGTTWGLWTPNYDPPAPRVLANAPYRYTLNSSFYNFTVAGP
jgi:hypothetical protein